MNNLEPVKIAVRSLYDLQKVRIELSNRVAAHREMYGESVVLETIRNSAMLARDGEVLLAKAVGVAVAGVDIAEWLQAVRGVGPVMAGVLISEVGDPARFENVGKLWAYCGLAVERTCDTCKRPDHSKSVDNDGVEVIKWNIMDKDGVLYCAACNDGKSKFRGHAPRRSKGSKSHWHVQFRGKLLGVLAPSILRARGDDNTYAQHYYQHRERLLGKRCGLSPGEHKKTLRDADAKTTQEALQDNGCTNGHMHRKALRYMIKMFMQDFLVQWRTIRKLTVRPPYKEEYLGKVHHEAK